MRVPNRRPGEERRGDTRGRHAHRTTALIQTILQDPERAARELENDLRAGGDANVTTALLAATESMANLRGMDLGTQIAAIRQRLKRAGCLD